MHNIELEDSDNNHVKIKGKDLRVEWLDSFILVWSKKDHPNRE